MLEKNEIRPVEPTLARLRRFVELVVQWNRSVSNLISKNDEMRIVEAHLVPSIEAAGWMKSHNLERWCDLGSGGGFPALPLILCGVGQSWDLVESRRTKSLFLRRAIGELKLSGVRVLCARIEDLLAGWGASDPSSPPGDAHPPGAEVGTRVDGDDSGGGNEFREEDGDDQSEASMVQLQPPYDGFTSRATLTLAPTLEYAAPIVRAGGHAFLWKGSRLGAEASASSSWRSFWNECPTKALSIEHSVIANFERISKEG